jgi:diguanylate cyclase (GGDEF)-like protein
MCCDGLNPCLSAALSARFGRDHYDDLLVTIGNDTSAMKLRKRCQAGEAVTLDEGRGGSLSDRIHDVLEALLGGFSAYLVPIGLGIAAIIALLAWPRSAPSVDGAVLPVTFAETPAGVSWEPEKAGAMVRSGASPSMSFTTRLSASPFWVAVNIPTDIVSTAAVLEFPSRHAVSIECWKDVHSGPIGTADRNRTTGVAAAVKAGFSFKVSPGDSLLCQVRSIGPAYVTAKLWNSDDLALSDKQFHRDSGLMDGGMMVLSVFLFLVAIINREWIYVIFSVWLAFNLRVAAFTAGWDYTFLEHSIPSNIQIPLRQLTLATYYVLTGVLFGRLFRRDLVRSGLLRAYRFLLWTCFIVLIATFLPYRTHLIVIWGVSAIGIWGLAFMLWRIFRQTRSRVAIWYGLSLGIMLLAASHDAVTTLLDLHDLFRNASLVTLALASSITTALAVAEQLRTEKIKRFRAQSALDHTYKSIPIGLFTLNHSGVIVQANPAMHVMMGPSLKVRDFPHWTDYFDSVCWRRLEANLAESAEAEIEIKGFKGLCEGRRYLVKAALSNALVECSIQDITERHEATARLEHLSEYDPLTDVLNRRGIEQRIRAMFDQSVPNRIMALAYLDLDRFKLINDLYGHPAGDQVLREICSRIKRVIGGVPGTSVGRVGGDEFVLVLPDVAIADAKELCQRIAHAVEAEPCQIDGLAFQIRCSIGVIDVVPGASIKDIVSLADQACRTAKRTIGSVHVLYRSSPEVARHSEEMALIHRFGANVPPEGLFLEMQPIMSLSRPTQSLNFEMLLRMRGPDNSVIGAHKIITAAEHNGRSSVIDRWVLNTTLQWLQAHVGRLPNTRLVSLNLSGGSMNDERFLKDALSIIREFPGVAPLLCVEVTETVAMHDLHNTRRFIDQLQEHGVKVALDDFGAGYTSFGYLRELAADVLKIDGMFVKDILRHPGNLAIIKAIAELSRNLGMQTIAEWAEDLPTIEALVDVGVDYVQGFAISKPVGPAQVLSATSSASLILAEDVSRYVLTSLAGESARSATVEDPPLDHRNHQNLRLVGNKGASSH